MKKLLLIPVLCVFCIGCNNSKTDSYKEKSSQENSSDWQITTKVKAAIMSDSTLSASARLVSVTTNNGDVTITGSVPSQKDMDRIVSIAEGVSGVKSVNNQMTISQS